MRFTAIISILVILAFVAGCGGGKNEAMSQSKKKNQMGLPVQGHQIDETTQGKQVIKLTDDLKYPGITNYENAVYDFLSVDSPEKVSKWYEENLQGATLSEKKGDSPLDSRWTITYKDFSIEIFPYGDGGALIRYKLKDL